MKQVYLFEADNLGFRQITEEDFDYLVMLDANPEVKKFFPGGIQTHAEIKDKIKRYQTSFQEKQYGVFVIFELNSGEFLGRAGFGDIESGEIEVGYLLLKKYWGKGYATRILKALLAWAKDNIHKNKIIAYTPVDHLASERVMQKAGMKFVRKDIMKGVECVVYEYKFE